MVHRDERLLVELLPDVPAFGEGQLCYDGLASGWQVTRVFANFSDLPTYFLADLREATAAPVLAAEVLDSDAAFVTGLGLRTPPWGAWLQLEGALGHLVPPPAPFDEDGNCLGDDWTDPDYEREVATIREEILAETPGGAVAAQAALAWAREAGLEPRSLEELTAAFNRTGGFVEDVFFALLDRIGFNTDKASEPARPAVTEVLRGLLGHRLAAVDVMWHRPRPGDWLVTRDMPDLLLAFDDQPPIAVCGCGNELALLPPTANPTDTSNPAAWPAPAFADLVGQRLTNAATIRFRYHWQLSGVVFRFGQRDLYLTALDGQWGVESPDSPPQQRPGTASGSPRQQQMQMGNWLAAD
ncbi:MAG TPA: hypothetical protein VFX60_13840 [Micromonospora sp.]|nr:hypothetical protein [Micromonospora sp.]